ncbi:hypothetical protein [Eubacterium xylanophilum]|uniref:hypothetical protein n=1 Tax=Eubacterium xylanophilum TaxID=39497 RepID=UPI00047A7011|nr:hypothetical protein [Eubacterium xylanophilum]
MNNTKNTDKYTFPEISVEDFDNMGNLEDHVFSEKYNQRKEKEIIAMMKKNRLFGNRFAKVAAAAFLVLATPAAVYAIANNQIANGFWGNDTKQNVASHTFTTVEEAKIKDDGTVSTTKSKMPKVEYVPADQKLVDKYIGDNLSFEPIVKKVAGTTITVNSAVKDKNSVIVGYTLEKKGGIDFLNYSQLDNETKGAWLNEDKATFSYNFLECAGKTFVDLKKSTGDKLYCYDYMQFNEDSFDAEHLTLNITEYTKPLAKVLSKDNSKDYIKNNTAVSIPLAAKTSMHTLSDGKDSSIDLSAISMKINLGKSSGIKDLGESEYMSEGIYRVEINYKDGSKYTVSERNIDSPDLGITHKCDSEIANYSYLCGGTRDENIIFNRIVDVDNIASVTVNDVTYTIK